MPELTGLQLSKIIKGKTKIIFTTAYSQFALNSYSINAADYLLKPFEFERLYEAVKKVENTFVNQVSNHQKIRRNIFSLKLTAKIILKK